jgi:hypothetical protein
MENGYSNSGFVLCIKNDDCDGLEDRKVYEVLPDARAGKDEYIRVIDESGEEYLYPASYFYPVELPQVIEERLRSAA